MQLIKYMKRGFHKVLEDCPYYTTGTRSYGDGEKSVIIMLHDHEIILTKEQAGELAERLEAIINK